ncbi:MAG: hypothetical protein J5966_05555, partial [Lachnospiraceae bacterium]|nr:hypothetical protein [Lachnospiraceae bacterium]
TGGICGINHGIISGCTFNGRISGKKTTGAIAAINEAEGNIKGCTNKGAVSGYYYTGGIAGKNYGSIYYSYNKGEINSTKEWIEGSDEITPKDHVITDVMSGKIVEELQVDHEFRNQAGVDTGGIAGFSRGGIFQCKNYKRVGYEHAGYNVGGIAGRQSGVISFCINEGKVYGRKDIGGIVGQMEPNLSVSELETLPEAVDRLHDLVEETLEDADVSATEVGDSVDLLTQYADNAVTNGDELAKSMENYLNNTADSVNNMLDKVDYITEKLPSAMDDFHSAGKKIDDMSDSIRTLVNDLNVYGRISSSANDIKRVRSGLDTISRDNKIIADKLRTISSIDAVSAGSNGSGNTVRSTAGGNLPVAEIEKLLAELDSISAGNDEIAEKLSSISTESIRKALNDGASEAEIRKRIERVLEEVNKLADTVPVASEIIVSVNEVSNTVRPYLRSSLETVPGNSKKVSKNLSDTVSNLNSGIKGIKDMLDHINSMPDARITRVSSDFDVNREGLADNLSGMTKMLRVISGQSKDTSHLLREDMSEVNDQINTVFHLISDEMDELSDKTTGDFGIDDIVTDVSEQDIDSVIDGKVDHSENRAAINGDINVGGITGSMAIDVEDPEENAAGDMNGGFTAKYLLRNGVFNCKNSASVTSKKDGVGGIAGYMSHGLIKDCESYGNIKSDEGDYAGGIAGQSLSIVKDCYSMAYLEGGVCVGGITGYGTTITNCVSIPAFDGIGDRYGAIAGQIDTDRDTAIPHYEAVSDNVYSGTKLAGINNVSLEGRAVPVSYDKLLTEYGAPAAFRKTFITFRVEDEDVKRISVDCGIKAGDIEYPEIPPKDGEYVKWTELDKDMVITAPILLKGENTRIEKTLLSETKYPGTDKAAAIVSGNFIEGDMLTVSVNEADSEIGYDISYSSVHDGGIEALRLYDPFKKSEVYGVTGDGEEHMLDANTKGNYMEIKGDIVYNTYKIRNRSILDRIKSKLPWK